ncbi:hypothetical protein NUH30_01545 [Leptospira sp. 85282-16]|uniref:hypothetical protein n=1 Tax=Leptospira sp. 85282-16 TaxID=2971256 RepID=UPI0021BF1B53|nr:hypothetical protein [Leptospira sp. 85282-16]MCT8332344.1 hypothetical protein [Leptospira sp. 85282-16]
MDESEHGIPVKYFLSLICDKKFIISFEIFKSCIQDTVVLENSESSISKELSDRSSSLLSSLTYVLPINGGCINFEISHEYVFENLKLVNSDKLFMLSISFSIVELGILKLLYLDTKANPEFEQFEKLMFRNERSFFLLVSICSLEIFKKKSILQSFPSKLKHVDIFSFPLSNERMQPSNLNPIAG